PSSNAIPGDLLLGIRVEQNNNFIRRGNDLYTPIDIDFVTAILGGKIIVQTLDHKNQSLMEKELMIPPGTQHATEFRIKNHGVAYLQGKGKGDQYVIINVVIPTNISKEQEEILLKYKEIGNQ
ncbi:MAG: molecular chaperone DnaJ, partial [Candidatus Lokiarchaeota archaeon]|nr:molecular chaperone DnaJ [Candidatus Lokiarchaeota archaeon]